MKKQLTALVSKCYGLLLNIYVLFDSRGAAKKAFYIFCKVRKGRVLPNQEDYLNSAKYKVENIAEHIVQTYKWEGVGETVVLVHGWESNTWRWHKLIEHLKEANYNIIAFDAPAHGNSSGKYLHVPLYEQVLEFIVEKYLPKFLIGHSMGGMTILYNEYLNSNTEVEKIIIIGAPSEYHEVLIHYQNLLGFNENVRLALVHFIQHQFKFDPKKFSSSQYVESNNKKGLLFHDKHDQIVPYHASQQVHAHWKRSKLISTEGLGHSMHQDEVNEQIVTFLES